MMTHTKTRWTLLLTLVAPLLGAGGCADFASYRKADADRNQLAVGLCERALGRASLALCDASGTCTCLAPSQGWDSGGGAAMARIHIDVGPAPGATSTMVASRR